MRNTTHLTRQLGLLSLAELENVTAHIIGVGGIGGPTALVLAKMGIQKIHLYDKDIAEPHNIGSQLFGYEDIGKKKVDSIKERVESLLPKDSTEIVTHHGDVFSFIDDIEFGDGISLVILALDSNDVRLGIYEALCNNTPPGEKNIIIVDPRMGGLGYSIFANDIDDIRDTFKKFTPTDSDVPDDVCTERAISFNTFSIAGEVGAICRRAIKKMPLPQIERCMNNFLLYDNNGVIFQS